MHKEVMIKCFSITLTLHTLPASLMKMILSGVLPQEVCHGRLVMSILVTEEIF